MTRTHLLLCLFVILLAYNTPIWGQITPPGLGKGNTASWVALGIRQELDTIPDKGWQSMTYIGFGQKSNLDNYNPFYKPAIWVLNQEFYNQFHNNWQYSFALSYRRQNKYDDTTLPYESKIAAIQQEFRIYSRFSYVLKTSRLKFIPTFRQEFRKFYTTDFANTEEDIQLRSRFRLQLTLNLNRDKTHKLIGSSEQLFSTSRKSATNTWKDFSYSESRFSLYYSVSPKKLPVIFNFGYMYNLVGQKNVYGNHSMAFDIIIKNPFNLPLHRSG